MMPRIHAALSKYCCAALLATLPGCGRSVVILDSDNVALAEQPVVHKTGTGAQTGYSESAAFSFPDDAGGVLLAKVLPPKDLEMMPARLPSPRSSPSSGFNKPPSLPLPSSRADLPRLPGGSKRSPLRPRLLEEETLGTLPDALPLPQAPALADNGRTRVHSPDVNQPIPLPMRAQPVPDRASLDDPTLDASTAAALAAPIPPRTNKAPFLKQSLPDPYDHRRIPVSEPEESSEFPLGSPQVPRR